MGVLATAKIQVKCGGTESYEWETTKIELTDDSSKIQLVKPPLWPNFSLLGYGRVVKAQIPVFTDRKFISEHPRDGTRFFIRNSEVWCQETEPCYEFRCDTRRE